MTLAVKTSHALPLGQLENIEPLMGEFAEIMVYSDVNLAFLDGEPFPLCEIQETHLALVAACTAVHTHTPQKRSWDTPIGVIEVEPRSFNILINGVEHTPETVDRYSQEIGEVTAAAPPTR